MMIKHQVLLVIAFLLMGSYQIDGQCTSYPSPLIITDFSSHCEEKEHGENAQGRPECLIACEGMTINYFTQAVAGHSYVWTVFGDVMSTASGASVDVTWGAVGAGLVQVTETDGNGCSTTTEVCVDIVESPTADFTTIPLPSSGLITICQGDEVYFFDNSSPDVIAWEWDFGDGGFSNDPDPSHTFTTGGNTYTVTLTVYNECGCSDTKEIKVKVLTAEVPIVACISTLCEKDEATYSVTNACPGATYQWQVISGGTLLSNPNDPTATVDWNNPVNGVGVLEVLVTGCNNSCPVPTQVVIPILSNNLSISGPTDVCTDATVQFSLPSQPNSTYTWNISPSSGYTIAYYGSMIEVTFFTAQPYVISVQPQFGDWRCDFGYGIFDLPIEVKDPFEMFPSVETICETEDITFSLFPSVSAGATWVAIDGSGGISTLPGSSGTSYTISAGTLTAGSYEIQATDNGNQYCNDYASAYLTINPAAPALSGGINGVLDVCDNSSHNYTASPDPGHYLEWTVSTGSTLNGSGTTAIGDEVVVTFGGGGPYTLSVVQVPLLPPACPSLPVSISINEIIPAAPAIGGPNTVCADVDNTYSITAPAGATLYNWSVTPNFLGSIVSGQGTPSPVIQFHQGGTSAVINLETTICNSIETSNYAVTITSPSLTIGGPIDGCVNDPIIFTGTLNPAGSASWDWEYNSPGITTPNTSGNPTTKTFNQAGSYGISGTATYTSGVCSGISVTSNHTIDIKPEPLVNVTGTNGLIICAANGVPSTDLVASVTNTTGSSGSYTFLWTPPSGPNQTTATFFGASVPGAYNLLVTDSGTGCTNETTVFVSENCDPPDPCPAPPNSLDFTVNNLPCSHIIEFDEDNSVAFASISWDFGDGNVGFGPNVVHTYENSGYYNVIMYVELTSGDICAYAEQVIIPYVPEFIWEFSCNGSNQIETHLINQTDYLPGTSGSLSYTWNVPTQGTFTTTDVDVVLAGGNYNVTLTVNQGASSCTIIHNVEVPDLPDATISGPLKACEDNPVQFTSPFVAGNSYEWDFTDGSFSIIDNPTKEFSNAGFFTIELEVTDEWGCTDFDDHTIEILQNQLVVSIDPTTPACNNLSLTGNVTGAYPTYFDFSITGAGGSPPVNSGTIFSTSGNPTGNVTLSGDYVLTVTDAEGCSAQSAIESVLIIPDPPSPIIGLDEYCQGDNITLVTIPGYTAYTWTGTAPGGGSTLPAGSTTDQFSFNSGTPGVYNVDLTVDNGTCTSSNTFTTTVNPIPVGLNISGPSPACVPATLTAGVSGGPAIANYVWSNGDTGNSTVVNAGGQTQVIAYTAEGCSDSDVFELSEGPDLSDLAVGCYCFPEPVSWNGPTGPGYTYQWYFNGSPIPGATGQTYDIDFISGGGMGPGVYNLEVTNNAGCSTYSDDIVIDLGEDCEKCEFRVELKDIECIGKDEVNGGTLYEITVQVTNFHVSFSSFAGTSTNGIVHNGTMTPSAIPGSGAQTTVTFNFTLQGGTPLIINFQGTGLNGINCDYDLIIEKFPDCETGKPCDLKFFEAKVECLYTNGTYSYYSYELPISNLGNTLTNLVIQPCNPNVTITTSTSTLPSTTSTLVTGNIIAPAGMNGDCFIVTGIDAITGEKCEWVIEIKFPKCKEEPHYCQAVVKDKKIDCGKPYIDAYGYAHYELDITISTSLINGNVWVNPSISQNENLVTNLSYTSSGGTYSISFEVVDLPPGNDPLCFGVTIYDGGKFCATKFCIKRPECNHHTRIPELANNLQSTLPGDKLLKVSPNPASTALLLDYNIPTLGATEIKMISIDGRTVHHLTGIAIRNEITLDVSQLASGLYSVLIIQDGELKAIEKVIVNHR